jgi:hypothetical protein
MPREQKLQQITRYAECFRPWVLNPADNYGNGLASAHLMAEILKRQGPDWTYLPCAGLLKAARPKESEISGRQMRVFREARPRYWYVSGIVLRAELIGGRAMRILISHGVGYWLSTANIQFPYELLALASSKDG